MKTCNTCEMMDCEWSKEDNEFVFITTAGNKKLCRCGCHSNEREKLKGESE